MLNISKILAIGLLVLGLIFGVMAWMGYRQAQRAAAVPAAADATAAAPAAPQVVVLTRAVKAGHQIQEQDIALRPMTAPMPTEALRSTNVVLNQVLTVALPEGTPLLPIHLVQGLSQQLRPGERAVSILVEEGSAVGHRIQPGDWVDVHFMLKRDEREIQATQARLLLSRKRVLAYGVKSTEAAAQTADRLHLAQQQAASENPTTGTITTANGNPPPVPRTAVLAVMPQDINHLALAEQQGGILRLALRHPADEEQPAALPRVDGTPLDLAVAGLTLGALAHGSAPLQPVQTPVPSATPQKAVPAASRPARTSSAAGNSVEVIRGAQRESIRY